MRNEQRYIKTIKAIQILIDNIQHIRFVRDWARISCRSREWLNLNIKKEHGKTPKTIINEVRFEIIVRLVLQEGNNSTSQYIAIESGLGRTSDSLHKFLKRNYNITFSKLKSDIAFKRKMPKLFWLNMIDVKNTQNGDKFAHYDDKFTSK